MLDVDLIRGKPVFLPPVHILDFDLMALDRHSFDSIFENSFITKQYANAYQVAQKQFFPPIIKWRRDRGRRDLPPIVNILEKTSIILQWWIYFRRRQKSLKYLHLGILTSGDKWVSNAGYSFDFYRELLSFWSSIISECTGKKLFDFNVVFIE